MIGQSNAIVFLLSPSSAAAEIGAFEIGRTRAIGKRIAPVAIAALKTTPAPAAIAALHHLLARRPAEGAAAVPEIARAVQADIAWVREQTRIGALARRWRARTPAPDPLLRGVALRAAEAWLRLARRRPLRRLRTTGRSSRPIRPLR